MNNKESQHRKKKLVFSGRSVKNRRESSEKKIKKKLKNKLKIRPIQSAL